MKHWHILWVCLILWTQTSTQAQTSTKSFLQAIVDNDTPYVGQPIRYVLRIYDAGLSADASLVLPNFEGFLQTELSSNVEPFLQVIDGIAYTIYIREVLLYPLKAGDFVIAPASLNIPETPFNDAEQHSSVALAVRVLPLPFNAPTPYENAVGTFTFNVTVTPTQLNVGESVSLVVTINGNGNLEQLRLSPPSLDTNVWRVLNRTPLLNLTQPTEGEKRFEWTLIPQQNGEFRLPELSFSFFSPEEGQYAVQTSPSVTITVGGNSIALPPLSTATLELIQEPSPVLLPVAWWAWGIPPTIALLWRIWRAPKARLHRRRVLLTRQNAKAALQAFSRQPHDQAYNNLEAWLNAVLTHPPHTLSLDDIQRLRQYIKKANEARYAPPSQENLRLFCQEVYQALAPHFLR